MKSPITVKIPIADMPSSMLNGMAMTTHVMIQLYEAGVPVLRNQVDLTKGSLQAYVDDADDMYVYVWRWKDAE